MNRKEPNEEGKKKTPRGKKETSWGGVSKWYDEHLELSPESYHRQVILPNVKRILSLQKNDAFLDVACGQGFFTRELGGEAGKVAGVDIASELIEIARSRGGAEYFISSADDLSFAEDASFSVALCVLALQNIENLSGVATETARVLKKGGRFLTVLNHPTFRIPKRSSWGWDEEGRTQYRRVDGYLSGSTEEMVMHPGASDERSRGKTISFHRSLQEYFKAFSKAGFAAVRLEEWISHKKSEKGPRGAAEDTARKEIPLFLAIEWKKL